jgi:PIN domain nuclease of toxin-antitoxin system
MYLDTHVVVWLYQKDVKRISAVARKLIETEDLLISPAVLLEMEYLFEIGKIREKATEILDFLHGTIQIEMCTKPFSSVVTKALSLKWTCDPFDRLITSQAAIDDSKLLTKDTIIHTYYSEAVW